MSSLIYSAIEGYEIPELVEHIKEIMAENDAHNLPNFSEDLWRWQYQRLPSKQSYIYVVRDNSKIVGYYHVPVYKFFIAGNLQNIAMIQDVAISPYLRGQGVFRKLAEFAHNHFLAEGLNIVYTFPNVKSIHTFEKYNGYKNIYTLPVYIKPLNTAEIIKSKVKFPYINKFGGFFIDFFLKFKKVKVNHKYEMEGCHEITSEIATVFHNYQQKFPIKQERDETWLKWRFLEKPGISYFISSMRGAEGIVAVAVFKVDRVLQNNALILMDFAYENKKAHLLLQLIQEVIDRRVEIFNIEINLVFTAGIKRNIQLLSQIGFFKIPKRFVPRELNLLVKSSTVVNNALVYNSDNWNVTLADWDVF